MFVIGSAEDNVEIRAAAQDKKQAVIDALRNKYIDKCVVDEGVGLCVQKVELDDKYIAYADKLVAKVRFQILFHRPYPYEVCAGKIIEQDEEGITIADAYFKGYWVGPGDLPEGSEFVHGERSGRWVWRYKNNNLYFQNQEMVLFRIKQVLWEKGIIEASMDEQGLGPSIWWS